MGKKAKIKGSHTGQLISPDHEFQDTNGFLGCEQESGAVSHCDQGQKDRVVEEQTRFKAQSKTIFHGQLKSRIKILKPKKSNVRLDGQDSLLRKKMEQCQQKSELEGKARKRKQSLRLAVAKSNT